jgi:transketolase
MRALPNMTVVAPGDCDEAAAATAALAQFAGPAYLRLDRSPPLANSPGERSFSIGQMSIIRDGGPTVLLMSTGAILATAMDAASRLDERGIGVTVVSCHTLKPFDAETLRTQIARGCRMVVTVEEHSVIGGLGSAVGESITSPKSFAAVPILRCGLPDVFPPIVGSQDFLRNEFGLTGEAIAERVLSALDSESGVT